MRSYASVSRLSMAVYKNTEWCWAKIHSLSVCKVVSLFMSTHIYSRTTVPFPHWFIWHDVLILSLENQLELWSSPLIDRKHKIMWCGIQKSACSVAASLFHRLKGHDPWKVDDICDTGDCWKKFHDPNHNKLKYLYDFGSRFAGQSTVSFYSML